MTKPDEGTPSEPNKEPERDKLKLADLADDDAVDAVDACRFLGGARSPISRSSLDRGIAAKKFPAPFKIGGTNRWLMGWLRKCKADAIAARTGNPEGA